MDIKKDLEKTFDQTLGEEIDLSSLKLQKINLEFIEEKIKTNTRIISIKFSDTLVLEDQESQRIFKNIKKYLEENELISQVEEILKKNDTITDLSRFNVNVRLLEIVKNNLIDYPNIGIIKWKEIEGCDNEEFKPLLEVIEKQLITNNEEFRRYPCKQF